MKTADNNRDYQDSWDDGTRDWTVYLQHVAERNPGNEPPDSESSQEGRSWTVAELTIILVILALLAAVLTPVFERYVRNAEIIRYQEILSISPHGRLPETGDLVGAVTARSTVDVMDAGTRY